MTKPAAPAFTPDLRLPWHLAIGLANTIRNNDGDLIAELPSHWPMDHPGGVMIVRAVNSHADLLVACEAAMRAMREVRDSDPGYGGIVLRPSWTDAWDAIGAALRRARGEGDQK